MSTLHRDFITYAEENGINLDHTDDYEQWYDCWYHGYSTALGIEANKSNNMSLKPTYYSLKEGGNWLRWPSNVKLNIDDLVKRDSFRVKFDSLEVHSIAFGEITAGYNCFIRWDCRNGFTDEPSNIIY